MSLNSFPPASGAVLLCLARARTMGPGYLSSLRSHSVFVHQDVRDIALFRHCPQQTILAPSFPPKNSTESPVQI